MANTYVTPTIPCPITSDGYIYMPIQASWYFSIFNGDNVPSSGTYLLRDILTGSPPPSGIIPINPPDFYGLEFTLAVVNDTGRDITFILADNSTPDLLTYFAFEGDGKYVIHPYASLYLRGLFYNNSLIYFVSIHSVYIDLSQYAQILANSIDKGYLLLSLKRRNEYEGTPSPLVTSGNLSIPIDTLSLKTNYYAISYNGSGTIDISGDASHIYMIIVISVNGGNPSLRYNGATLTLQPNNTYFIGITKGYSSITIVNEKIDLYVNTFIHVPLRSLTHFGVKGIDYTPINGYIQSAVNDVVKILNQ